MKSDAVNFQLELEFNPLQFAGLVIDLSLRDEKGPAGKEGCVFLP